MLYLNKYVETLFLFFFKCLLNHNDDVSHHLEYLLARAAILNTIASESAIVHVYFSILRSLLNFV